jgi:LPXTG-motif cell wall-anchored protein
MCKEVARKEGGLMKLRRLLFVTLAVLIVTTLFSAVATAQNSVQKGQSADLVLPTNATGYYDTGHKQVDVQMEGQTDNKRSHQTGEPQRKQPREKPERYTNDDTPLKPADAPASAPASAPAPAPAPAPAKELPKTGGSSAASLFALGAGALLVAGGLLARRFIR